MSSGEIQVWLPYLSQIPTATVAIVAILANRRSSKETLATQLSQRVWERRTEIYLEIIRQTGIVDPNRQRTPEGFRNAATAAGGEKVSFLPVDANSNEWRF
jgi:hypothetical protein